MCVCVCVCVCVPGGGGGGGCVYKMAFGSNGLQMQASFASLGCLSSLFLSQSFDPVHCLLMEELCRRGKFRGLDSQDDSSLSARAAAWPEVRKANQPALLIRQSMPPEWIFSTSAAAA